MGKLCCVTASDADEETELSPSLTLERVLTVFLIYFEAAIDTLPFAPPIPSTTRQAPAGFMPWLQPPLTVWEYTCDRSGSPTQVSHNLEDLPNSYRQVHAALQKQNLCDHFCFFLEAALRAKLAELSLGTVRWMSFNPHPLAFYTEIMPDQDHSISHLENLDEVPPPIHSVLEIKTISGDELVFDGTPEQFGWSDTASTQDNSEVEAYYVKGQEGMWKFFEDEKKRLNEIVLESAPRPWGILYRLVDELLAELDWDTLKNLEDDEVCRRVRHQAQRKFAILKSWSWREIDMTGEEQDGAK